MGQVGPHGETDAWPKPDPLRQTRHVQEAPGGWRVDGTGMSAGTRRKRECTPTPSSSSPGGPFRGTRAPTGGSHGAASRNGDPHRHHDHACRGPSLGTDALRQARPGADASPSHVIPPTRQRPQHFGGGRLAPLGSCSSHLHPCPSLGVVEVTVGGKKKNKTAKKSRRSRLLP